MRSPTATTPEPLNLKLIYRMMTLKEYLEDNIDRMQALSNMIRDELSYGKYGSMAAELDSYISELKDIAEIENKDQDNG
jgi:hypothetical protein